MTLQIVCLLVNLHIFLEKCTIFVCMCHQQSVCFSIQYSYCACIYFIMKFLYYYFFFAFPVFIFSSCLLFSFLFSYLSQVFRSFYYWRFWEQSNRKIDDEKNEHIRDKDSGKIGMWEILRDFFGDEIFVGMWNVSKWSQCMGRSKKNFRIIFFFFISNNFVFPKNRLSDFRFGSFRWHA